MSILLLPSDVHPAASAAAGTKVTDGWSNIRVLRTVS